MIKSESSPVICITLLNITSDICIIEELSIAGQLIIKSDFSERLNTFFK